MVQSIAAIKGWHVEEEWIDNLEESEWGAVRKLEKNWFAFRRSYIPASTNTRSDAAPAED
jgi:hypothetical protein